MSETSSPAGRCRLQKRRRAEPLLLEGRQSGASGLSRTGRPTIGRSEREGRSSSSRGQGMRAPTCAGSDEARAYFARSLQPTLVKGLAALCREKPCATKLASVAWLAEWLATNNPNAAACTPRPQSA
eukprot:scaffold4518_cov410-Prasinococcus_capsulatus_cf.AAC.27